MQLPDSKSFILLRERLPEQMKRPLPTPRVLSVGKVLSELSLATVCEEASCPNRAECYGQGHVSFMILGDVCTRGCSYCGVSKGKPVPIEELSDEPERLASAVRRLGLDHVVVTSVARDDLPDGGAGHFRRVMKTIRDSCPGVTVELLVPEFLSSDGGWPLEAYALLEDRPDVFNHNIETVRRLTRSFRPQGDYDRSLSFLSLASSKGLVTKSGFMVGCGETEREIQEVIRDLSLSGVEILTIGQYIPPTGHSKPVQGFLPDESFENFKKWAIDMGIREVLSGALVRSSYLANRLQKGELK
ncbi:MAG: lipoyl synthase [Leptospirillum sp.]|jgi:lipoic acid synthetase